MLAEASGLALQMAVFLCLYVLPRPLCTCEPGVSSSPCKATSHVDLGLTLTTLFSLNHLFKGFISEFCLTGSRTSTYGFGGIQLVHKTYAPGFHCLALICMIHNRSSVSIPQGVLQVLRVSKGFYSCSAQEATLGSPSTTAPAGALGENTNVCTQDTVPTAEGAQVLWCTCTATQPGPCSGENAACPALSQPVAGPPARLLIPLCLSIPHENSCFIICLSPLALEGSKNIEPNVMFRSLPSILHIGHQGTPPPCPPLQVH